MIKAIETVYNGYKFRSRLEARWAVFFDTLGLEYQYELEGFDLDGVWYLPDFWLPGPRTWLEVKSKDVFYNQDTSKLFNPKWWQKLNKLHLQVCKTDSVAAVFGEPYQDSYELWYLHGVVNTPEFLWLVDAKFNQCLECGSLIIQSERELPNLMPDPTSGYGYDYAFRYWPLLGAERDCEYCRYIPIRLHGHLERAYTTARQARFEHGQNGTI